MADLIIQIGHLSYWRHLRRMTCRPSPNLMGNVWHFDLNVMGPGIENNLCFTTTNVSCRLGNNRQADTIIGGMKDGPVYPIRGPIIVQLPSSHYSADSSGGCNT